MSDFSELITSERKKRGYSLRDAGAVIGISHTYLSAIEKDLDPRTGKKPEPSIDVMFKICKAYDLDISRSLPLLQIHDEYGFFIWIAKHIREMKKTNPRRYKELRDIITDEKVDNI